MYKKRNAFIATLFKSVSFCYQVSLKPHYIGKMQFFVENVCHNSLTPINFSRKALDPLMSMLEILP